MAADAAVSAGVVLAGPAVRFTGRTRIDPAASPLVVAIIAWGTWGLSRAPVGPAMDRLPSGIDSAAVATDSRALPGVVEVHNLHI